MSSGGGDSSSAAGFSLEGIDDVQDFPWVSEGEGPSMSWERYSHLNDLMHAGNKAFRENRLDQAIEFYSKSNNIKPDDPVILGNRCAAYLRICQFLKHRLPSASEYRPLSGLYPTTHAGLDRRMLIFSDILHSQGKCTHPVSSINISQSRRKSAKAVFS